jgi:hypothetical protein
VFSFLAGFGMFISGGQRLRGASSYIVNENFLTARHAIDKTNIPFSIVMEVSSNRIHRIIYIERIQGKPTPNIHFENSMGESLRVFSSMSSYFSGMFISVGDGECVLHIIQNKDIVALTLEDPERMYKELLTHFTLHMCALSVIDSETYFTTRMRRQSVVSYRFFID